jgi:hypothetical protein
MTAPAPVCTPQPSGAATSNGIEGSILTRLEAWHTAWVAKDDWPKKWEWTGLPSRLSAVVPSERRPPKFSGAAEAQ